MKRPVRRKRPPSGADDSWPVGHDGLDVKTLVTALAKVRQSSGGFRAPSAVGFIKHSDVTQAMASMLTSTKTPWTYVCRRNRIQLWSPTRQVVLAIATGNEFVGTDAADEEGRPLADVANPKRWFGAFLASPSLPGVFVPDAELWVLLWHVDGGTIHYELSKPEVVSSDGRVLKWAERRRFEAIKPAAAVKRRSRGAAETSDVVDDAPSIPVTITKRRS